MGMKVNYSPNYKRSGERRPDLSSGLCIPPSNCCLTFMLDGISQGERKGRGWAAKNSTTVLYRGRPANQSLRLCSLTRGGKCSRGNRGLQPIVTGLQEAAMEALRGSFIPVTPNQGQFWQYLRTFWVVTT